MRSNVKSCPRVLKQSRRIYEPKQTAIIPMMNIGDARRKGSLVCGQTIVEAIGETEVNGTTVLM